MAIDRDTLPYGRYVSTRDRRGDAVGGRFGLDCRCVACLLPSRVYRAVLSYPDRMGACSTKGARVCMAPVAQPHPKDTRTRLGCTRARRPTGGSAAPAGLWPIDPPLPKHPQPTPSPLLPPGSDPDDDGFIIIQTMHPPQLIPNPNHNNKHNRHTPEPRRTSRPGAPEAAAGPQPRRPPPPPPATRP